MFKMSPSELRTRELGELVLVIVTSNYLLKVGNCSQRTTNLKPKDAFCS